MVDLKKATAMKRFHATRCITATQSAVLELPEDTPEEEVLDAFWDLAEWRTVKIHDSNGIEPENF